MLKKYGWDIEIMIATRLPSCCVEFEGTSDDGNDADEPREGACMKLKLQEPP